MLVGVGKPKGCSPTGKMSDAKPVDSKPIPKGHDNSAFDVEYQMPKKAEPLLDHQGRVRSSE